MSQYHTARGVFGVGTVNSATVPDVGTESDDPDHPDNDDPPALEYPNGLARRVAKAFGVSTHRPVDKSPGPS